MNGVFHNATQAKPRSIIAFELKKKHTRNNLPNVRENQELKQSIISSIPAEGAQGNQEQVRSYTITAISLHATQ